MNNQIIEEIKKLEEIDKLIELDFRDQAHIEIVKLIARKTKELKK